jgi:hypothetical protein
VVVFVRFLKMHDFSEVRKVLGIVIFLQMRLQMRLQMHDFSEVRMNM